MATSASPGGKHFRSGIRVEVGSFGDQIRNKKLYIANPRDEIFLFAGHSNPELAHKVAEILETDLIMSVGKPNSPNGTSVFPNGELDIQIARSVRKKPVHIMQAATPGEIHENLMEVCILLDLLRSASSGERSVFYSPFPYERKDRQDDQQRKDATRQSITARLVMDMMEAAGANRFQALDIHVIQEAGFTKLPFDPLYASRVFVPHLRDKLPDGKKKALSPDIGGLARVKKYDEFLGLDGFAFGYKTHGPDGAEVEDILGDVEGCHVLLIDDVIASGKSIVSGSKLAHAKGALSVTVVATHGQFIDEPGKTASLEQLENAGIEKIYVTDTLKHRLEVVNHPLIEVVSVAPLVADMVRSAALANHPIHDFVE